MIDIKLTDGRQMREALAGFERQIPFATALALTRTAQAVQKDLKEAMPRHLDRPTRFTLNGTYVKPATKNKLIAEVGLKDWAAKGTPVARYLSPQIQGGPRGDKRSERAMRIRGLLPPGRFLIPGDDAPLNQFGNITAGQTVKALSHVRGQIDEYQHTTSSRAKGKAKRSGRQFFMMGKVGIFYRQGKSLRSFLIIGKQPMYRQRFDFFGISAKSIEMHLPEQAALAIETALSSARP